jgi:hypothetical protein
VLQKLDPVRDVPGMAQIIVKPEFGAQKCGGELGNLS